MKKKIISLLLSLLLFVCVFPTGAVASDRVSYVVLGDSIAYGSGLSNPTQAVYGKIVAGRRIIDAETGAWVDVEDPGLARRIPTGLGWLRSLWHFVRGHSFGRRG